MHMCVPIIQDFQHWIELNYYNIFKIQAVSDF